jgi:hypothetical protein
MFLTHKQHAINMNTHTYTHRGEDEKFHALSDKVVSFTLQLPLRLGNAFLVLINQLVHPLPLMWSEPQTDHIRVHSNTDSTSEIHQCWTLCEVWAKREPLRNLRHISSAQYIKWGPPPPISPCTCSKYRSTHTHQRPRPTLPIPISIPTNPSRSSFQRTDSQHNLNPFTSRMDGRYW